MKVVSFGFFLSLNLVASNYVWDKENKLWKWVENKPKLKKQANNRGQLDLNLEVFNELDDNKKNRKEGCTK